MSISFPLNPVFGQVYTNPTSNQSWKWNGYAWESLGNVNPIGPKGEKGETGNIGPTGPAGPTGPYQFYYQDLAPTGSITEGSFWYDSDLGNLYVYVDDGNTTQWVTPTALIGATGPTGPDGIQGATGSIGATGISGAREYWPTIPAVGNHRVFWPNYNGPANPSFHSPDNFCGGIFWNYDDLQITEARIRVGVTGSGNGYVALYKYNLPADNWLLVATTSEYNCTILGEQIIQFVGGTVSMVQNYYSIGAIQSTNGPRLTCNSITALRTIFGYGGNYLSSHNSCLQFNSTYSVALPATQSPSYGGGYGAFLPMIYVK